MIKDCVVIDESYIVRRWWQLNEKDNFAMGRHISQLDPLMTVGKA